MDPITQKRFDEIVAKDVSAITPQDVIFLKSRYSYLTPEQRTKYLNILMEKIVVNDDGLVSDKVDKLALFRNLKKQAKERGIDVPKGTKLAELKQLLA